MQASMHCGATSLLLKAIQFHLMGRGGQFGKNIKKVLGNRWNQTEVISKHKMDEIDLVTAAASIIAKVTRDSEIEKLNDSTDFEIGSGYPSDLITRKAVKKMIVNGHPHDELRWTWKTVKEEWLKVHNKPLPVRGELGKSVEQKSLDEWTKSEWIELQQYPRKVRKPLSTKTQPDATSFVYRGSNLIYKRSQTFENSHMSFRLVRRD